MDKDEPLFLIQSIFIHNTSRWMAGVTSATLQWNQM